MRPPFVTVHRTPMTFAPDTYKLWTHLNSPHLHVHVMLQAWLWSLMISSISCSDLNRKFIAFFVKLSKGFMFFSLRFEQSSGITCKRRNGCYIFLSQVSNPNRNVPVLTVFILFYFLLPNPHVPQSHNALSICCKTAGTRGLLRPKNASWRPSFMGDQMAAMRLFMTSWKRVVWLRNDRGHELIQEDGIFITRRCWNRSSFLNKKKEEENEYSSKVSDTSLC